MKKCISNIKHNWLFVITSIVALGGMCPADREIILSYLIAAVLLPIVLFSLFTVEISVNDITRDNTVSFLFGVFFALVISILFYQIWSGSSQIALIANRLRISSGILVFFITIVLFCCVNLSITSVFISVKKEAKKGYSAILEGFLVLLTAFITFVLSQIIVCRHIMSMGLIKTGISILIIVAVFSILRTITASYKLSVLIGSVFFLVLATVDFYVYSFRGREISPFDLRSINTALNVASTYHFSLDGLLILCWIIIVFMIVYVMSFSFIVTSKKKNRIISFVTLAVSVLLMLPFMNTQQKLWKTDGSTVNGFYFNLLLQIKNSVIIPPEGYDSTLIATLDKQYSYSSFNETTKEPSIIVIMNESFTDFSSFSKKMETSNDVLPFLHSLKSNVIKGYVYSSVYGGNTANSEFEFLTGNTMAFLPAGTTPYQQYIYGNQYSLVSFLHEKNYYCVATHPYFSSGWNRVSVYNSFGFDKVTFIEDYPQINLVRNYISDYEMYEYVIKQFEERPQDKGFFLFGITMQNHGGYEDEDFQSTVMLDYSVSYPDAEQFLTLTQLSDSAVEYLLSYFSEISEPVVVCFFGDHQPKLDEQFLEMIYGGEVDDLQYEMNNYKVPFFIWTNYDIDEEYDIETSINYLSNYVLDAAEIGYAPYNRFLRETEKAIPIITAIGYYSNDEQMFQTLKDAKGEEKKALDVYYALEYNSLFDKEKLSKVFETE